MKIALKKLSMVLPLCIAMADCSTVSSVGIGATPYVGGNLGQLTYRAVDLMLASAPDVTPTTPIIVASISNTQNVETTTPFGNIVADMIRTRLSQDGRASSEIRLRSTISFNKGDGEFLLTRSQRSMLSPPNAGAILTGTYAASLGVRPETY